MWKRAAAAVIITIITTITGNAKTEHPTENRSVKFPSGGVKVARKMQYEMQICEMKKFRPHDKNAAGIFDKLRKNCGAIACEII